MKLERKKSSIADWHNLAQDTESAIDTALRQLKEREAADSSEARQIEKWKNRLKEHYVVIKDISSGYKRGEFIEPKPARKQEYIILKDQVRRAKEQVRSLPKLGFEDAQSTMKDLFTHTKVFISAGPHGPGGGRPRGAGPGIKGSWGAGKPSIKGPKRSGGSGGGQII
jgi:hypothetical protein